MYGKPNAKGHRADDGADLSPEEMEAAIALFKAQQAASQAAGEGSDGGEVEGAPAEDTDKGKSPVDQVRENISRRDSGGGSMAPEEIIAEQKEDLDTLLAEIDRLQAMKDMDVDGKQYGDNGEEEPPTAEGEKPADVGDSSPGEGSGNPPKEDKGVNMDSVDEIFKARLDVCRMADKLNLDGIEELPVKEGKKRIIKAVNPKINLDGKSGSYIDAAYDIAKQSFTERKTTDQQRQKIAQTQIRKDAREECGSNTARRNMINRMTGGKK